MSKIDPKFFELRTKTITVTRKGVSQEFDLEELDGDFVGSNATIHEQISAGITGPQRFTPEEIKLWPSGLIIDLLTGVNELSGADEKTAKSNAEAAVKKSETS